MIERWISREKFTNDKDFFERIKIGVVPACRGAGATLIATSVAKLLSENETIRVSYIEVLNKKELGDGFTYDAIGIDKRFAGRKFHDLFKMNLQGEGTRGITNLDDGINWILHTPKLKKYGESPGVSKETTETLDNLRILNNAPGDVIICDFEIHEEIWELLQDMDVLIIVIDPMPSSLLAGLEMIMYGKFLEGKGRKIFWVINKDNEGVNKRELLKFLKLKELHYIPIIKSEELYSAEYNCMLPINKREARSKLQNPINKIITLIFG